MPTASRESTYTENCAPGAPKCEQASAYPLRPVVNVLTGRPRLSGLSDER